MGGGGRILGLLGTRVIGSVSFWILSVPVFFIFHLDEVALSLAWGEAWMERAGVEWEVREGW